jgi:hypothetical protein
MAPASVTQTKNVRNSRSSTQYTTWSLGTPAAQAALWEAHMLQSGCQLAATHYTSVEPDAIVALGNRSIADAQRDADDAAGGLVALACGRR